MLRLVHRDSKFDKQSGLLQKANKKASIAVKKAEEIIDKLRKGAMPEDVGVLTNQGDYRIENCIKYDLGAGYRLVTSREGDHLFILYIGTHDECHNWLENNKGWKPELYKKRGKSLSVEPIASIYQENQQNDKQAEDTEDYLDQIEDRYLRIIFWALCSRHNHSA